MEDPNIRRLIDATHQQYPDAVNYAILSRQVERTEGADGRNEVLTNLFEEVETESFMKIGVKVIWADSYSDVPTIVAQICQLDADSTRARLPALEDAPKSPMLPGQKLATPALGLPPGEQRKA
jgi:hypothetical protein